jgi:hypothetical protein
MPNVSCLTVTYLLDKAVGNRKGYISMPHGRTKDNFISPIQGNFGSLVQSFPVYTNNFGVKDFKECTSLIQDVRMETI